jgi:hypothetical protein
MKPHEDNSEQISTRKSHQDTKPQRAYIMENTANPKKRRDSVRAAVTTDEAGDLRGIMARAQAESTDLYDALLESGVIKNAAEFFERSNQ